MGVQQIAEARVGAGTAVTGDLSTRIKEVVTVATKHATAVDSAARFPAESFEAVKAQRLLGITVPKSLGGEGASISDAADVCYQLGQVCSSTGMIYAMHQVKVACIMRHMGENATLQRMLRRLCAEQLLMASSTTEGSGGGNIRNSEAPVEHHEGGRITLERKASVISYGAYADGVVSSPRRPRRRGGDRGPPCRRCRRLRPGADRILQERLQPDAPQWLGRARHARHLQRRLHGHSRRLGGTDSSRAL